MLLIKPLLAFRPSKVDLFFACKTFFAGMLALYIAFRLDLLYPMWAIGTVFIIANPYSGMVSSKALYRLAGTFVGAAVAVILTPHLINTPLLFTLVLAIWTGFCLYISMLDRTPRSYAFMLAGYSCVMVACNAIFSINTYSIFDIALGRVLEISIAIICTAVVSATIFPLHLGDGIQQRVQKALADTEQAFRQIFADSNAATADGKSSQSNQNVVQLLSAINRDTNDLHGLAVHLNYEKGRLKGMTKPLQEMLHQFSLQLINMVAISERVNQLRQIDPHLSPELQSLADQCIAELKQPIEIDQLRAFQFPQHLEGAFQQLSQRYPHAGTALASLQMDMRHFMQNVYNVKVIWQLIQAGQRKIPEFIAPMSTHYPSLHRDHGVAVRGAIAAFASIMIGFSIWIYSGWQYGYMLAQMGAVIACILTALDDPIPLLKIFLRGTVYATIIVFIYLFFILPDVKTFLQLALVLAPVMIYALCLVPHPPLTGIGLPIAINVIMALNLQNHYQISALPSIDAALAGLFGPIIPVLALYLIRAMSPDMTAKRLIHQHYQEMRSAIHLRFGTAYKIYLRRMVDRIGLLNTKMVASSELKYAMQDVLIESCVAIDLTRLSEVASHADTPAWIQADIQHLIQTFDDEFSAQSEHYSPAHYHYQQLIEMLAKLALQNKLWQKQSNPISEQQQRLAMSINNLQYALTTHQPETPSATKASQTTLQGGVA